jgi:hypothetical protein
MALSLPFFTVSVQLGAWHAPPVQTPLWQSLPVPQVCPVTQRAQLVTPPQSAWLSPPFLTVSVQVGAWQVFGVPLQTPLWQSPFTEQRRVVAHFGQSAPPQSTSVSPPFCTRSEQLAD